MLVFVTFCSVGFITLYIRDQHPVSNTIRLRDSSDLFRPAVHQAVLSEARLTENVMISDFSVRKESTAGRPQVPEIISFDGGLFWSNEVRDCTRAEDRASHSPSPWGNGERFVKRVIGEPCVYPTREVVGRSLSKVLEDNSDARDFWLGKLQYGGVNRNVGSQFSLCGIAQKFRLPSHNINRVLHYATLKPHLADLCLNEAQGAYGSENTSKPNKEEGYVWGIFGSKQTCEIAMRLIFGPLAFYGGIIWHYRALGCLRRWRRRVQIGLSCILIGSGLGAFLFPVYWQDASEKYDKRQSSQHNYKIVPQIFLTSYDFRGTVIT